MPDLSRGAFIACQLAAGEAARALQQFIERESVFIGICSLGMWLRAKPDGTLQPPQGGQALRALRAEVSALEEALQAFTLSPSFLRHAVQVAVGKGTYKHARQQLVHRSQACKMYFQRAEALAVAAGAQEIHCLHLLGAILEHPGTILTQVLMDFGVDIRALLARVMAATSVLDSQRKQTDKPSPRPPAPAGVVRPPKTAVRPALERYLRDLTQEARDGKIDPIIGRKNEILAVVRALHQKTRHTPVLISEPGVSRIAVIKGLALRIARGDVIAPIRGKRIMELHVGALVGVPLPQGHFELCLRQVFDAASRNPEVILFIDEIHALVGPSNVASSVELPNILATALGRSNLRCIGATTVEHYERYIAADPVLERCCQPIMVHEPSVDDMREILQQVCPRFEQHHRVTITPDAMALAVALAARYLPEKRFPEKAIDLMDQACSRARITQLTQLAPREADAVTREVTRVAVAEVMAEKTGIPLAQLLHSVAEHTV